MSKATPHINVKPGTQIAESILLPGDPLRAKYIAENYLEDAVMFNDVRNMFGYTGRYKGKLVSAMGTGMGIPSISIYATELVKFFGVKNLIRVGSCGAAQEYIQMKDIIIAQGTCTNSGFNRLRFPGDYAPIANFDLLRTAYDKSQEMGLPVHVGLMTSGDLFYGDDMPDRSIWAEYGVLGGEMEGAALYTIAAKYKVRALMMAMVTDGRYFDHELTAQEREQGLGDMIRLALDTIVEFTD